MVAGRNFHAGDLLFSEYYPRIDLSGGGSVFAWTDILEVVMSLCFEYGC